MLTKPLKPLARGKYWDKLIAFMQAFNERFDHLPADYFGLPTWMGHAPRDAEPWQKTAFELYRQASRMHRCALAPRCEPLWPTHAMRDYVLEKPGVGALVFISHIRGGDLSKAVGMITLIEPWRPDRGAPRLYDNDDGPFSYSTMWTIKLLDGSLQRWHNCSPNMIVPLNLINAIDSWRKPMTRSEAEALAPGGKFW